MLFWRGRRPGVLVSAIALALVAGCTSSVAQPPSTTAPSSATTTPTIGPTPTPTATPTWNPEQAAAIEAVRRLFAADEKIGTDPSAFTTKQMTQVLGAAAGGEALDSMVRWHQRLKARGYRFTGQMVVLSTAASRPANNGRGVEVHVTHCQDQRQGKVVDKSGDAVRDTAFQLPAFNLRQYSVRKPPGEDAYRVFGFATINGTCP